MADVEMQKFETAVENLCADWAEDIAKILGANKLAIGHAAGKLGKGIDGLAIPVPPHSNPVVMPKRINEIVKQASSRLAGVVEVELEFQVDTGKRRLVNRGAELKGKRFK
jgi:hypothetical protein